MIAYVFWHRPSGDAESYERRLAEFHARLRTEPPDGFRGSAAFSVDVPWMGTGYEDWYLVDDWSSLGVLNAAAVDAAHRADHDAVARDAAHGAGGVYALRSGGLRLDDAGDAQWSAKPLDAPKGADYALWQRQMVLGPAPEYCLLTPGERLRIVTFRG